MLVDDVSTPAYGGSLVNLLASAERVAQLGKGSRTRPSVYLSAREVFAVELLSTGALSPLRGFMTRRDYESVVSQRRLTDGMLWTLPVVLRIPAEVAASRSIGDELSLRDAEGVVIAVLQIEDLWESRDGAWMVGGPIEAVELPQRFDFRSLRLGPVEARREFARRGWSTVLAVQSDCAIPQLSHMEVRALVGNGKTGVLMHAFLGSTPEGDPERVRRIRRHRAEAGDFPPGKAIVGVLPFAGDVKGFEGAVTRAIVARNFGCSHLVLERTAPSTDLVQVLEREVGMAVLPVDPVDQAAAVRVDVPVDDLPNRTGFTVFLTGLSGSGKSTISNILLAQIAESGRAVTLLDGDVVRRHLSSELGFSREHRELNIRRIGFVACEITKHGGIAICAPIAPYAQTREEVRAMIERVGSFVLVHVATPLDVCEARDRKGLYAKARAGLIEQFTGISDPYEVPGEAHVTIDTTKVSAQGAAGMILDELFARGLLERRHFAIDDNGSDG